MTTIRSNAPYYDDFDGTKNFHQILFRPGFAVQARELTQIQSILKNQIERFGNHIFKQGSIVLPGNSRGDLAVPYTKIETNYLGVPIDISQFEGKVVVGETSGVTGIVKKAIGIDGTDPITFYIAYTSGGVIDEEPNGQLTFSSGETLAVLGTTVKCVVKSTSDSIGIGSLAFVNEGVYYVNGTFVHVDTQSVVIDKYSNLPSCHVLLKIVEDVVTYDDDSSLLDPSQGSYNFAAPGADRYKLSLELVTLPLDSAITEDYVEIMRYRGGVLEEHARTPKYNELEKSLARRTYDESGNYVVNGLYGVVSEDKRISNNGGLSVDGNEDKFAITVAPGKAYINGFEVEKIAPTNFSLNKARTVDHVARKTYTTKFEYGRYIYVTNIKGNLGISSRSSFDIYNADIATNPSAQKIGTGRILGIDYHSGDPTSDNAIYKLYYISFGMSLTTNELVDAGSIKINATNATAKVLHVYKISLSAGTFSFGNVLTSDGTNKTATVHRWEPSLGQLFVYKQVHSKPIPRVGELITSGAVSTIVNGVTTIYSAGQGTTIFRLPVTVAKSIRDTDAIYKHSYVVQKQVTITTDGAGAGSVNISDGVFRNVEVGTFIATTSNGIVSNALFSVSIGGTQLSITGGPVNTTIAIYCAVEKNARVPRTKTLTTTSTSFSGYPTTQRAFVLNQCDVYDVISITDSTGDITNNFVVNSGQTDYYYGFGSIVLKSGKPVPTGTITVQYRFFAHSAGDFFSIDSYANNTGYENFALTYTSTAGESVDLRNCIDFRPTQSGASFAISDLILNGEWFYTPIQYYTARYDLLVVDKDGSVKIINGSPAEQPSIPNIPTNSLAIEQYYVPPYTKFVSDIVVTRYRVERYTMADITKLANRVQRLEEFSTLSAVESELIAYDIVDAATGISRFKTGYFVETFTSPLTIADATSEEFAATFDKGTLIPSLNTMVCPTSIVVSESSTYTIRNNVISLPYTEKVFASQNVSSRVTNLNPFLVISWDGTLRVNPSRDSWIETLDLPDILVRRTETVTVTNWIPVNVFVPVPIPAQPVAPVPAVVEPAWTSAPPTNNAFDGGLGDGGAVGSDGGNSNGPGDGGGGDGGGKIICTALYKMGLMDEKTYTADQLFGELMAIAEPDVMKGYHAWASIIVDWMDGKQTPGFGFISSDKLSKWAIAGALSVATPWGEHMAFSVGATKADNALGSKIMKVGKVLSKFVGKHGLLQQKTMLSTYSTALIALSLWLYSKAVSK